MGVNHAPSSADIIEKLARQLEQQIILCDLQECRTLEDFQKLAEKYEVICDNHGR